MVGKPISWYVGVIYRYLPQKLPSFLPHQEKEKVGKGGERKGKKNLRKLTVSPGIACDIPTGLYSFSFELDPNWGRFLSAGGEIKAYHDRVRDKYCLRDKIAFSTEAYRCEWDDGSSLWTVYLRDRKTGEEYSHKCQILFSAAGQLVVPRKCDIPGSAKFKGRIMHSAEWDSSLDLKDNNVVVLGNGCE